MAGLSEEDQLRQIVRSGGQSEEEQLRAIIRGGKDGPSAPRHGMLEGVLQQGLEAGTLHASKHFLSQGTLDKNARFQREHPWASTAGQAAGFIAPMLTPAGWIAKAPAMLQKVASYALPFSNFSKAVAPGAGLKTIAHQSGMGSLKAGAIMRGNDPVEDKDGDLGGIADRAANAGNLKSMAADYGLGAVGGYGGAKVMGAVGSGIQKTLDQIPRFGFNKGTAGNGYFDWTRGGAQRAHEALTGDLRPGQTLEEAATHGMLGNFNMRQAASGVRSGYANRPAPWEYKYELARRYSEAIEAGATPVQARQQVAAAVAGDRDLVARFNLRGKAGVPAINTISRHVGHVAKAMDEARQFPTTLQERVAMSQGGTSPKGTPTYGAAPNSYAAVDEMLTSPGSKDPGSARAAATNWVTQRQQTQSERVNAFLDEKLGRGDVHEALAAHQARKDAAYDLYDPAIAAWKGDPKNPAALRDAIAGAIRKWRERPDNYGLMTTVSRDVDSHISNLLEKPIQVAGPSGGLSTEIRTINDLQKFIAQRSNFTRAAEGVKISDPSLYRSMQGFKRDLDDAVRPLAPEWAAANDTAATAFKIRRAFTEGESFPMGASSRQAEKLAAFRKMDPDSAAAFKAGLNAQLQKRLNAKTSTGDQHVLFSQKQTGDVLRAVMGEADGNEALRQLQAVAAASKTNKIFGQSATHGRESEERANRSILKLIQSAGSFIANPLHGIGEVGKAAAEKMATEAARARNDRALRILTANTDDMSNYFRQIKDVTDSSRNHLPAVTQRIDELMRRVGTMGGIAGAKRRDDQ